MDVFKIKEIRDVYLKGYSIIDTAKKTKTYIHIVKKIIKDIARPQGFQIGQKFTDEHKKRISSARMGIILSEETKKRISLSKKGQMPWNTGLTKETDKRVLKNTLSLTGKNNGMYGKKLSNQHKERISKKLKNRIFSSDHRRKLRIIAIKRIEKQKLNGLPLCPAIGNNETKILNFIEENIGYKMLRQYRCNGYFIDGYIPDINLAIEIDEKYHNNQVNKDINRQTEIEQNLNCKFIRIDDGDFRGL